MRRLRSSAFAYGLLLPAFASTAFLIAYPLYLVFTMSLREGRSMTLSRIGELPLGFANYARVLSDPATWHSLRITLAYVVLAVAPAFLLGLALALLLNQRFPGRRWLRSLVLLPWAVPGVVVSIAFLWMLDASFGVVNYVLRTLGLIARDVAWFASGDTALFAVIIPTVWKGYPFFTLMLLAALQAIPHEFYEAARVDGASRWQQFRFITWPGIQGTAVLALILNGLWAFREFDIIFATTGGGPARATQTLALRVYNEAFAHFQLGLASSLGVFMLALSGLVIVFAYRVIRREYF